MNKETSDQKKKINITKIIDWGLLLTLIAIVLWAKYQGAYIDNEIQIVEVCRDQIINNPTGLNITPVFK